MGDSVLTLPSLQALRSAFPDSRISVLFPEHSVQLLEADPRADQVLAYPRNELGALQLGANAAFYKKLQAEDFDLVIALHASFRTALLAWGSGAEVRAVRNHSGRDWFSTIPIREAKEAKSIIQRDFDVMRALGLQPKDEMPDIVLSAQAKKEAAALGRKHRLRPGRSLLLFPFAGKKEKEWPWDSFLALKSKLEKAGRKVFWVLAPGQKGPEDALRVQHLLSLAALCRLAGYCIGNDSGPRHLASAAGARTLTLFGPEELREWQPYKEKDGHWALKSPERRMDALKFETVFEATKKWLGQ